MEIKKIPTAILDLPEYAELATVKKENFSSRLTYIEELARKIIDVNLGIPKEQRSFFINDLELDISINIAVSRAGDNVSPWIVHTSWAFGLLPGDLAIAVDAEILPSPENPGLAVSCTWEEFHRWLQSQGSILLKAIERFYEAKSLETAIGCLFSADYSMSVIYSSIVAQRFNPKIF